MPNKTHASRYLSLLFYVFLIPYSAHFLISIRERSSLATRLHNKYYWIALAYTLLLSYVMVFAIACLSGYLDKRKLYANDLLRVVWQLVLGLLLPLVLVVLATAAYFGFFGENIVERGYFVHELPIVVLYLTIINGFYLFVYINNKAKKLQKSYLQDQGLLARNGNILVHYRGEQLPVSVAEIAMVNQVELVNWLITSTGESYIWNRSLKEISKLLGHYEFFQINRKQIVRKAIVKKMASGSFGKLALTLGINYTKPVIVSKDRAKSFKKWLAGH